MNHPSFVFKEDAELDIEIAWEFFESPVRGGDDFWQSRVVPFCEDLADLSKESDPYEKLVKHVRAAYGRDVETMRERERYVEELITLHAPAFFAETDRLFPGFHWPHKKITIIFSIFAFCPRFLKVGYFQVFLEDSDKGILFTAFHEMLHFLFYSFVKKSFPEYQDMDTEQGPLWILAELFNAVIQNTPEFVALHGKPGPTNYKVLEPLIDQATEAWNGSVYEWVKAVQGSVR